MKTLPLFFSLLITATACHVDDYDQDPTNARRIEGGVWHQEGKTKRTYHFNGGLLTTQVIDFGIVLARKEYAYHIEMDTVYLTGMVSGTPEKWAVWMFDDNDAQVTVWSGNVDPFIFRVKKQ